MKIDPTDIFATPPFETTRSPLGQSSYRAEDGPAGFRQATTDMGGGGELFASEAVSAQERRRRLEAEAMPLMDLLYSVARRLVGNDARAEDLVQETYLRAFRAAGQYRLGTNCKAWLLTILRSAFVDSTRQAQARGGAHEQLPADVVAPAERTDLPMDPQRFISILDRLVDDDVRDALLQLPALYREAFVMVVIAELSYKEAALVLGVHEGTLKSRVFRACQLLKAKLWHYAINQRLAREGPSDSSASADRPAGEKTENSGKQQ